SLLLLFFYSSVHHLNLPSFPTRRSSDLVVRIFGDDFTGGLFDGGIADFGAEALGGDDLGGGAARFEHVGENFFCDSASDFSGFRSEEHTSELQSRSDLVCRLLLEKKKKK